MTGTREKPTGSPDRAAVPPNLRMRLEKCPRCEYERREGDDEYATPYECPRCGVVYALAMEELHRKNRGRMHQDEAEVDELRRRAQARDESVGASQVGGAMFVGRERSWAGIVLAVLVGLAALAAYLLF
jgi:hypothetical protein